MVLGGIALFIYGFSFLKGSSLFENDKIIYTVYEEVEGLVPGAKVSINGLTVGKITEIDFLSNSTKILITMSIRDELNFSNKSTALLYETGLIGGMAVAIQPVFDKGKAIVTGDTLMSEVKPQLRHGMIHALNIDPFWEAIFDGMEKELRALDPDHEYLPENHIPVG